MVHDLLTKPIRIQLGNPKDGLVANEDVTQHLVLLRSGEEKDFVLVFVARKNTCDFVANMLNRIGIRASPMHSDRLVQFKIILVDTILYLPNQNLRL